MSAAARAFLALEADPLALQGVMNLGVADPESIQEDPRAVVSVIARQARDLMIKWSLTPDLPDGMEDRLAYFMTVSTTHYVAAMDVLVTQQDQHLSAALSLPINTYTELDRRGEGPQGRARRGSPSVLEAQTSRHGNRNAARCLDGDRSRSLCGRLRARGYRWHA